LKKIAHSSKLYYHYLRRTGLFTYLSENLLKLIYIIAGFVAVLLLIEHFVIPMEELFDKIVQNVSYEYVFVIFGVSETILGLIPPDLFIMWGKPLAGTLGVSPWLILFVLATLSYLGGIMAYFLGLGLQSRKGFKQWMELKHTDMFNKLRKWGGFLIGVAALLPIPFSLITLISGITRFPFKILLAVGLLRYLRFFLYAIVLWIMV
jgi:membrane protein YqaA with SNARE-associated domain